jgi:hypothetical protein
VATGAKSRLKTLAVSGDPNKLMALAARSITD